MDVFLLGIITQEGLPVQEQFKHIQLVSNLWKHPLCGLYRQNSHKGTITLTHNLTHSKSNPEESNLKQ